MIIFAVDPSTGTVESPVGMVLVDFPEDTGGAIPPSPVVLSARAVCPEETLKDVKVGRLHAVPMSGDILTHRRFLKSADSASLRVWRIQLLARHVRQFLTSVVAPLDAIAIEQPNRGRGVVTGIHEAIGVCYAPMECICVPYVPINAATVKSVIGTHASRKRGQTAEDLHEKERGVAWAVGRFGEDPFTFCVTDKEREAVADALAVAVAAHERLTGKRPVATKKPRKPRAAASASTLSLIPTK